jgi:uncharacterized protein YndB with AHSA1/START domain
MAQAERTLVKSPPELWELVDDAELMRRWATDLLGVRDDRIEVTRRSPGERLAWRPLGRADETGIELSLSEKGWGTNVVIEARRGDGRELAKAALEEALDELSAPQRRPFTRA